MSSRRGAASASAGRHMGLATATGLVVASMIGTGVFTTTGLLAREVPSPSAILACWLLSGIAALAGALAYAELGAAFAQSGGEYYFLSRLFHPALGFVSAWVSFIVGFAAPLAAIALAFGRYLSVAVPGAPPLSCGVALVVLLTAVNIWRVAAGTRLQNALTVAKLALIVAFIVLGLALGDLGRLVSGGEPPLVDSMLSPGFAVGLLWVSFSYTGWNASAYVAGELAEPERVLPRALVLGTLVVTVLYVAMNVVFLAAAPLPALSGKVEVGHVAARALLGIWGGRVVSAVIAAGLMSTVGAMIVTGPRIYEAVGKDMPKLGALARRRGKGGPLQATLLQSAVAVAMMLSARFESLLVYVGFTLSVFGAAAVAGVFVLRHRDDIRKPYRMWGYPFTPCLYLALMAWMVVQGLLERPLAALAGLATAAVGLLLYWLLR